MSEIVLKVHEVSFGEELKKAEDVVDDDRVGMDIVFGEDVVVVFAEGFLELVGVEGEESVDFGEEDFGALESSEVVVDGFLDLGVSAFEEFNTQKKEVVEYFLVHVKVAGVGENSEDHFCGVVLV